VSEAPSVDSAPTPTTALREEVLVVDDDPMVRRLLSRALEQGGYHATVVGDSLAARRCLRHRRFTLAVCDLNLPGESGLSLIRHIAAVWPNTAILVVSGQRDLDTVAAASDRGASDYLIKPFGIDQLLITIDNALRRRASGEDNDELRRARLETVRSLVSAIEARDGRTSRHSDRVSRYSGLIARTLELDQQLTEQIEIAARLHDVGKIGVPDRILRKPGPLSAREREIMQRHSEIGRSILAGSGDELLELAARIAWAHHERLDGGGYPRGLRGGAIPKEARIVAVADVFDALTNDRPYRSAHSIRDAEEILLSLRGSHLDGDMVDALLSACDGPVTIE
jgi:putative two-component system response regulator